MSLSVQDMHMNIAGPISLVLAAQVSLKLVYRIIGNRKEGKLLGFQSCALPYEGICTLGAEQTGRVLQHAKLHAAYTATARVFLQ